MKKKVLVPVVAMSMLVSAMVGGTLAYLTDTTNEVENTFTVGNVDITLEETTGRDYKMVPGVDIAKDPVVTVVADSEDCWLFVEVVENGSLNSYIAYTVDEGWTHLSGNIYYREVTSATADQEFEVLTDSTVTTKNTVTQAMMDAITAGTVEDPTLTFKAYAIQQAGFTTAADAWAEIQTPSV